MNPAAPSPGAPVVALVSPKGGSGTTTVAVNLAVALARHGGAVLVETDCANPNIEFALRLQPSHRLDDLSQRIGSDLTMLLTPHGSGIGAVCAPHLPQPPIEGAQLTAVISQLRGLGRPVVIDTGPGWGPLTLAALRAATHVGLVATPDVAAIRALQRAVAIATREGLSSDSMHLVLNRNTRHRGVSRRDLSTLLPYPIWMEIPEDPHLTMSANLGTPLTLTDPGGPLARDFRSLADRILAHPVTPTP